MIEKRNCDNWFETWFDSPFYHKLYANRDFSEAEFFISNLVKFLDLKPKQKVLDLACGGGRHAFFLSKFDLDVLGLDLAENSIKAAQKLAHEHLHFGVHDMREVYPNSTFDVVFNLFTSFGYFDSEKENLRVLNSIHDMLNPGGKLIIDFMNAHKIVKDLVPSETKIIDEISFQIKKHYDGKHIFKEIDFEAEGKEYHFTERVQALKAEDFEKLLQESGFSLKASFGDYALNPFDLENSSRLILFAEKI